MNMKQVERWAPWVLLASLIAIWQLICWAFNVSEFIFPSPARVAEQAWEHRVAILGHAWRAFWVTMVGFGIAIVVGVLLGFVIGSSRIAYAAIYPAMTAFNALPKAAFVPILVVWFGIGIGPAILTAFLIIFFPIMVNTFAGVRSIDAVQMNTARTFGIPRLTTMWHVVLPAAAGAPLTHRAMASSRVTP